MRSYKNHKCMKRVKHMKTMKRMKRMKGGAGYFNWLFQNNQVSPEKQDTSDQSNDTMTTNTNTNTNTNGKDLFELSYKGKKINCEICGDNKYKEIFVSINRSKTFDVATTILGMGSASSTAGHPLTLYLCRNCNNCRFFYTKTPFNDYEKVITTTPI